MHYIAEPLWSGRRPNAIVTAGLFIGKTSVLWNIRAASCDAHGTGIFARGWPVELCRRQCYPYAK
jgi:hypothetical protein